jgi:hypothetical protein
LQSQLDCLVFENKKGNDSGLLLLSVNIQHAKASEHRQN